MYSNALLTDLYELTMGQAYWRSGVTGTATFSLFFRKYPSSRGYFVFAGLEHVLDYLESLRFSEDDLGYLESLEMFDRRFLKWLRNLRFTGDVRAMTEGTLFFVDEPVLEVRAPIIEAQIAETYLLNQVTLQSMLATKASRVVHAARGRNVVDFAARRAQGTDAANKAARAGYMVGYGGTSNVQAAAIYGIPPVGTMAHSFIMSFEREADAFRAYAHCFPDTTTLLVDTYDTLAGVKNAIEVAREMARSGNNLRAVRLDSGKLADLAFKSRRLLDEAGRWPGRVGTRRIARSRSSDRWIRCGHEGRRLGRCPVRRLCVQAGRIRKSSGAQVERGQAVVTWLQAGISRRWRRRTLRA
jgi:nicotinate phosphoribosyltransferase